MAQFPPLGLDAKAGGSAGSLTDVLLKLSKKNNELTLHIEALEEQRNETETALAQLRAEQDERTRALEERATDLESQLAASRKQDSSANLKTDLERLRKDLDVARARLSDTEAAAQRSINEASQTAREFAEREKQLKMQLDEARSEASSADQLKSESSAHTHEREDHARRIAELNEQLKAREDERSKLNSELQGARSEIDKLKSAGATRQAEVEKVQPALREAIELKQRLQALTDERSSLQTDGQKREQSLRLEMATLTAARDEAVKQLSRKQTEWDQQLAQVRHDLDDARGKASSVDKLKSESAVLVKEREDHARRISELNEQLKIRDRERGKLGEDLQAARGEIEQLKTAMAGRHAEIEKAQPVLREAIELKQRVQELAAERSSLQTDVQKREQSLRLEIATLTAARDEAVKQLSSKQAGWEQQLAQLRRDLDDALGKAAAFDKLKSESAVLVKEREEHARRIAELNEQLRVRDRERGKLGDDLQAVRGELDQLKVAAKAEQGHQQKVADGLNARVRELETQLRSAQDESGRQTKIGEDLRKLNEKTIAELAAVRKQADEVAGLRSTISAVTASKTEFQGVAETLRVSLGKSTDESKKLEARLLGEKSELQKQLESITARHKEATAQADKLQRDVQQWQTKAVSIEQAGESSAKTWQTERKQLGEKIGSLERAIADLQSRTADREKEWHKAQVQQASEQKALSIVGDELRSKLKNADHAKAEAEQRLQIAAHEITELRQFKTDTERLSIELRKQIDAERADNERARAAVEKASAELQAQLAEAVTERDKVKATLTERERPLREQLDRLTVERDGLTRESARLKFDVEEATRRLRELEVQATRDRDEAAQALQAARDEAAQLGAKVDTLQSELTQEKEQAEIFRLDSVTATDGLKSQVETFEGQIAGLVAQITEHQMDARAANERRDKLAKELQQTQALAQATETQLRVDIERLWAQLADAQLKMEQEVRVRDERVADFARKETAWNSVEASLRERAAEVEQLAAGLQEKLSVSLDQEATLRSTLTTKQDESRQALAAANEEKRVIREQLEKASAEVEDLRRQLKVTQDDATRKEASWQSRWEKATSEQQRTTTMVDEWRAKLDQEREAARMAREQAATKEQDLVRKLDDARRQNESLGGENKTMRIQSDDLRARSTESAAAQLQKERELNEKIQAVQTSYDLKSAEFDRTRFELNTAKDELATLREHTEHVERDYREEKQTAQAEVDQRTRALEDLSRQFEAEKERFRTLSEQNDRLQRENATRIDALEKALESETRQHQESKRRMDKQEEEFRTLRTESARGEQTLGRAAEKAKGELRDTQRMLNEVQRKLQLKDEEYRGLQQRAAQKEQVLNRQVTELKTRMPATMPGAGITDADRKLRFQKEQYDLLKKQLSDREQESQAALSAMKQELDTSRLDLARVSGREEDLQRALREQESRIGQDTREQELELQAAKRQVTELTELLDLRREEAEKKGGQLVQLRNEMETAEARAKREADEHRAETSRLRQSLEALQRDVETQRGRKDEDVHQVKESLTAKELEIERLRKENDEAANFVSETYRQLEEKREQLRLLKTQSESREKQLNQRIAELEKRPGSSGPVT